MRRPPIVAILLCLCGTAHAVDCPFEWKKSGSGAQAAEGAMRNAANRGDFKTACIQASVTLQNLVDAAKQLSNPECTFDGVVPSNTMSAKEIEEQLGIAIMLVHTAQRSYCAFGGLQIACLHACNRKPLRQV